MVNLPNPGQANWDVPLNTALAELAHSGFTPSEVGMIAWNYDPATFSSPTNDGAVASGGVYLMKMPRLTQATTIANIHLAITDPVVGPVAGQSFVGLYDADGTRVSTTAPLSTVLTTKGMKTIPLAGAYNATPGYYYVGFVHNAATPLKLARAGYDELIINAGLANEGARYVAGPGGQTSLPAEIDLSTSGPGGWQAIWAGVS